MEGFTRRNLVEGFTRRHFVEGFTERNLVEGFTRSNRVVYRMKPCVRVFRKKSSRRVYRKKPSVCKKFQSFLKLFTIKDFYWKLEDLKIMKIMVPDLVLEFSNYSHTTFPPGASHLRVNQIQVLTSPPLQAVPNEYQLHSSRITVLKWIFAFSVYSFFFQNHSC